MFPGMEVETFFFLIHFWLHQIIIAEQKLSLFVAGGTTLYLWCTGFSLQWLPLFWSTGFRLAHSVVANTLSCSMACGIFPDQGWNPGPLPWRWILNHQTMKEVPLITLKVRFVPKLLHVCLAAQFRFYLIEAHVGKLAKINQEKNSPILFYFFWYTNFKLGRKENTQFTMNQVGVDSHPDPWANYINTKQIHSRSKKSRLKFSGGQISSSNKEAT